METKTDEEAFVVAMVRHNKVNPPRRIKKTWKVGRLEIAFDWRSKKNLWGRFGGGWNWKLGFQAGGRTINFMILICTLCFDVQDKQKVE